MFCLENILKRKEKYISKLFQHVKDFEDLVRTIVTLCSGEEQERLREMEDWIVKNEGTWVLSEGFNVFLSNVFHR